MSQHPLTPKIAAQLALPKKTGPACVLVNLAYDHIVQLRVEDVLDFDAVADDLLRVLESEGPASFLSTHAEAFLEYEQNRVTQSGETLREALPQVLIEGIEQRMNRRVSLPKEFGREIVDPTFIRNLVTASLTETLEGFLTKLPLFGGDGKEQADPSSGGGLLGNIARKGAKRLQNAGSALSGIGAGLQESLKTQAREFASQSADKLKQGILDGFKSSESRGALKTMRKRALDSILNLKQADIHAMLDDPDTKTQIDWAQAILQHNLARPEFRNALRAQIIDILKREETRTLGEILAESGLADVAKKRARDHCIPQINALAKSDDFKDWLSDLLTDAEG